MPIRKIAQILRSQPLPQVDCSGEALSVGDKCILLDEGTVQGSKGMTITIEGWTEDGYAVLDIPHPEPPEVWVIEPRHLMKKPAKYERCSR